MDKWFVITRDSVNEYLQNIRTGFSNGHINFMEIKMLYSMMDYS